jgi:hypothetical protein
MSNSTTEKPRSLLPESERHMPPTSRQHRHHAEAFAIQADLKLPFPQQIAPHTHSKLNESGGYATQHTENFRLGRVFSFRTAYTHVAGHPSDKPNHGWHTLSTCVVEGLNVMEVLTADRIVMQISADHPLVGYVPKVTFLGTRFENLRIAGKLIEAEIDLKMLGSKPAHDAPYTTDSDFISKVTSQRESILARKDLPASIRESYNQLPSPLTNRESIECSLVHQVTGTFPGNSFGHILEVPDFGKIHLAVLRVEHSEWQDNIPTKTTINLDMIKVDMGCIGSGSGTIGGGKTNGVTN